MRKMRLDIVFTISVVVYVFSPSCSAPLAVHKAVCQEEVVGAVFIPTNVTHETQHHVMKSRLYFMDRKQVCYSLN